MAWRHVFLMIFHPASPIVNFPKINSREIHNDSHDCVSRVAFRIICVISLVCKVTIVSFTENKEFTCQLPFKFRGCVPMGTVTTEQNHQQACWTEITMAFILMLHFPLICI